MKKTLIFLFSFVPLALFSQDSNSILGIWMVEKKDAKVEIYRKGNSYFGKIIWLADPTDDRGNPAKNEKGEGFMGMEIMKDFVYEDGEWINGSVYDAEEGKTYHGSVELLDDGRLKLRGSIDSFGILGRTDYWMRAD